MSNVNFLTQHIRRLKQHFLNKLKHLFKKRHLNTIKKLSIIGGRFDLNHIKLPNLASLSLSKPLLYAHVILSSLFHCQCQSPAFSSSALLHHRRAPILTLLLLLSLAPCLCPLTRNIEITLSLGINLGRVMQALEARC